MRKLTVKLGDCSCGQLITIAKRCGFSIKQGNKHCKVISSDGRFVTTIPRHNRLKRETVRGIVKKFNEFGGVVNLS